MSRFSLRLAVLTALSVCACTSSIIPVENDALLPTPTSLEGIGTPALTSTPSSVSTPCPPTSTATAACFPQLDFALRPPQLEVVMGLSQGRILQLVTEGKESGCLIETSGNWSRLHDLSPSGDYVLADFFPRQLYLISLAESSSERVAQNVVGALWLNEETFLYWTTTGALWSAHVGDTTPCSVTSGVTGAAYCPSMGRLAIERTPEIYMLELTQFKAARKPTLLTSDGATHGGGEGIEPLWSPDCQHLLFPVDPTNPSDERGDYLAILDITTTEVRRLYVPQPSGPIHLSPSGNHLVYTTERLDQPNVTWIMDLDWRAAQVTASPLLTDSTILQGPLIQPGVLLTSDATVKVLDLSALTIQPVDRCQD
jgi:hypothetical protein